jgi:putative hydrolase of the HAD superfamily
MAASNGRIDAVLVDVGGVFCAPDHKLLAAALEPAGGKPTADALDRGHYAGAAALDAHATEETLDWNRYARAFARQASVPEDRIEEAAGGIIQVLGGEGVWSRVLPGSIEGLRRLATTGVGLGIVSNSDGTVAELLVTHQVCQVGEGEGVAVAVVIDSAIVGVSKPDPAIFALALQALGVPAERAVHVGDTVFADVAGARAAGVRPFHLDPYGFCPLRGDHEHVRSLTDLASVVARSRGS